jgi:ATP-dependent exoDNAse (exonuclease V) alpha subunit
LRHKDDIATQQSVDREKQMIGIINQGIGRHDRLDRGNLFVHSDKLSDHQKDAVDFILASRDFAVNLQGAPGTGKTWTMQEVYRGLREAAWDVVAVAPTRSAKEELEKVGIANPITLEKLPQDKVARERLRNGVVMLDEAGMVSCRQMSELLRLGRAHNARFIFSGDTKQIQPVEAGGRAPHTRKRIERQASCAHTDRTPEES